MPATPELANRLKQFVSSGAGSAPGIQDAFIEGCLSEAIALVDRHTGTTYVTGVEPSTPVRVSPVPVEVLERAYIEVGADLFYRKSAPQGVSQFTAVDGSAIRLRRDPLDAVRPMLAPFLPGGFA